MINKLTLIGQTELPVNEEGMFNASALAKKYNKDVYGYTRNQKVKELVKEIAEDYNYNFSDEFTVTGKIVRVVVGGAHCGTWMHLDIFIKFCGWLSPKLEREIIKQAISRSTSLSPLEIEITILENSIKKLKRKLSNNRDYKDLNNNIRLLSKLQKNLNKEYKNKRNNTNRKITVS